MEAETLAMISTFVSGSIRPGALTYSCNCPDCTVSNRTVVGFPLDFALWPMQDFSATIAITITAIHIAIFFFFDTNIPFLSQNLTKNSLLHMTMHI
jgi:hypothetical protein